MYQFRVTKYDPVLRDSKGFFTQDQWTSRSDIGRSYLGKTFTEQEYMRIELAYLTVAENMLQESGVTELIVSGLEWYEDFESPLHNEKMIEIAKIKPYFQAVLRQEYWCRFEINNSAFVHFGRDYYMYLGLPSNPVNAVKVATDLELFVELFTSPYLHHDD